MAPRNNQRQVKPDRPPPDLSNIIFRDNDDGQQLQKYTKFYTRSVVPTKYISSECLETLGMTDSIVLMLNNTGLTSLCTNPCPTYEPLVLEFLSSFSYTTPVDDPYTTGTANFRMFNQEYSLDQERVAELLSFTRGEHVHYKPFDDDHDLSWDQVGFSLWNDLTGQTTESWRDLYASQIHNPALRYFHRVLANTIFGRTNNHKVNQNELFIIFCALNGQAVNVAPFMLSHIHTCVNAAGTNPFVFGGIITSLAYALGLSAELLSLLQYMMPATLLDVIYCRDSHIISPRHDGRFTLVINRRPIPDFVLPCPNRIDVRVRANWRYALDAPAAQQPDNPAANFAAMQAHMLRQDQLFHAMQQNQAETLRLVQEVQRDQQEMRREQQQYAFRHDRNLESLQARIADALHLNDSNSDVGRRPRTRGRRTRAHDSQSNE